MSESVFFILEVRVKPEARDSFPALVEELVEHTGKEPGAQNYEWFSSEDGETVHIFERYADSDALMTHMAGFGEKFAARFFEAVDPIGMTVYGDPSPEAAEGLGALGPTMLGSMAGFRR